jgi:hypothetical protein
MLKPGQSEISLFKDLRVSLIKIRDIIRLKSRMVGFFSIKKPAGISGGRF